MLAVPNAELVPDFSAYATDIAYGGSGRTIIGDPYANLQAWGRQVEMENYQALNRAGVNRSTAKVTDTVVTWVKSNSTMVIGAVAVVGLLALMKRR